MINLRGHHMFCTTLFTGNGYSDDFCTNMYKVKALLPNEKICIVKEQDIVCSACPHSKDDGTCQNGNENVILRDINAIEVVGIETDKIYSYKEILEKLSLITKEDFEKVCNHCQWGVQGLCNYEIFLNNLNKIILNN